MIPVELSEDAKLVKLAHGEAASRAWAIAKQPGSGVDQHNLQWRIRSTEEKMDALLAADAVGDAKQLLEVESAAWIGGAPEGGNGSD